MLIDLLSDWLSRSCAVGLGARQHRGRVGELHLQHPVGSGPVLSCWQVWKLTGEQPDLNPLGAEWGVRTGDLRRNSGGPHD